MLNKIELKDKEQIKKIELKLKKNKQTEIHKKTYWFLFILILVCLISFSTSIMFHYCIEDLFPDISMSKLFLDINSENDITGKTYKLDKYNDVISMSHATWNGLPEYAQNSNIAKLIDQNNSISCYKCCREIPTIEQKCIMENDNFFNNGIHNDLWFSIRNIKPHNFKYKDHNTYNYKCKFQYVSRNDIRKFYCSINEKTDILEITSNVINFGRSLHNIYENSCFKSDIINKYKGIIFMQNNEIANTISYSNIVEELENKINKILSYGDLTKEDINIFTNIIINRLLGISNYDSGRYDYDFQDAHFVITRVKSEIDMQKVDKVDLITPFKNFAVDIGGANRKVYTVLNTLAQLITKSNVFLVTGFQEYGNMNYDYFYNDPNSIKREIIRYSKLIAEHCSQKLLNPTGEEEVTNLNISYKDTLKNKVNINLYKLITESVPNDYKLDKLVEDFKNEFIKIYGKDEYYKFISSLYDLVLFPTFKIVNNKFGEDIKRLSVKSHTNNSSTMEISSNLSQNLVPNKIFKLSDNNNCQLMLQLINIEELNLEELANLINFTYSTSYSWKDLINPSHISNTIPNLIATDIIKFIETDRSILKTAVKDRQKQLGEYISILYHWNYIISDLNKFKHVPDNTTILPNIDIKADKLESSISFVKHKKNSFFSKKISNNLIPKNIYELMITNNVLFECFMNTSSIMKFNNIPGFHIIGLDILLEELTAYVLRTNVYNFGIQPHINSTSSNTYLDKIKYIRSRDLYFVSLPYKRFMSICTKEKDYIFSKINQIPHLIYNDADLIPSLFFIVSQKTKKAICVDPISCIFGTIVSESTRYSNISKIVHEIIYPISSNKSNIPRVVINLLMPDLKFNDNFYIRNNNVIISSLRSILSTNLKMVMKSIDRVQYFDITHNKNEVQIKFVADKNLTHEFLHSYVTNFSDAVLMEFTKSPATFIAQVLFDSLRNNNIRSYDQNILDLLYDPIKSIKDIPKIRVSTLKKDELQHEMLFTIKNLDRNKMSNFCEQLNKSENEIQENYRVYKKYIEYVNLMHLSPTSQKYKNEDEDYQENSIKKKKAELLRKATSYIRNFDMSCGNKCKSGNKISHLRLKLIDKLHQITSLFFSN